MTQQCLLPNAFSRLKHEIFYKNSCISNNTGRILSYNGPILRLVCAGHHNTKQKGRENFRVRKITVRALLLVLLTALQQKYHPNVSVLDVSERVDSLPK